MQGKLGPNQVVLEQIWLKLHIVTVTPEISSKQAINTKMTDTDDSSLQFTLI